jgi:hypothetical protein
MTPFPGSPRLLKAGLVLVDPGTAAVRRVIVLQYNPETLSRTLQPKGAGEGGDRSQAMRLTGPPVETISLEAEIDATDQLEKGAGPEAEVGIQAHLAALETIAYPSSDRLLSNNALARSGTLEIAPMQAPLTLFVWSKQRTMPVRLTEFSVTEEAFDPSLNPIRAKVSLGLRVLSVDDLGFEHRGGAVFMAYQQRKEGLAGMHASGALDALGLGSIP